MPTKLCTQCSTTRGPQPITDFALKCAATGRRQSICKLCSNAYRKTWYLKNRKRQIANVNRRSKEIKEAGLRFLFEYLLVHPCVDCGETDLLVLDFDHRKRSTKVENLTLMAMYGYSIKSIRAEVKKCAIRCANCHRRKTAREQNTYRYRYVKALN